MQKITPARLVRGSGKSSRRQRCISDAVLETLERRQLMTTYVVDNASDLDDANYGLGQLTLREAVNLANANLGTDTINFDMPSLNPGFSLFGGALGITDSVNIDGTNLNASGGIATINGQALAGVMTIGLGATVNLEDIQLRNGRASQGGGINNAGTLTLLNTTVTLNSATAAGGGIYNTGTVTLQSGAVVSSNTASTTGGGVYNSSGAVIMNATSLLTGNTTSVTGVGGGIYTSGGSVSMTGATVTSSGGTDGAGIYSTASASISLTNSTISNNSATRFGGGIFNTGTSSVSMSGSTISGNSSGVTGSGGGIYSLSGTVSITGSTINANRTLGPNGGGIRTASTLNITNSTISNNIANSTGGGLFATSASATVTVLRSTFSGNVSETLDGGGIASTSSAVLRLLNSTVSGNTAARGGGGIYGFSGNITITNTTITNNRADSDNNAVGIGGGLRMDGSGPTVTMNNTIVADNYVGVGVVEDDIQRTAGTLTASNNLIGTGGSGGVVDGVSGNKVGIANPLLGALANNGGSTLTHALLQNSPAREGGSNSLAVDHLAAPLGTDQRGATRIIDTLVDIGSYEASPFTFIVDNASDLDDANYTLGNLSLREAVLLANNNPGTDSIQFDLPSLNPALSLFSGALNVTDKVTINGTNLNGLGGLVTVNGQALGGVIDIATGIAVSISNIQFRNGRRTNGGAILNNGTLNLSNVTVTLNSATTSGGGIYNTGALTITGASQITANNASLTGGGIHNTSTGTILFNGNSSLSTNTTAATGLGGALYNAGGQATISGATVSSNTSNDGGAVYNTTSGSIGISNVTMASNRALRSGGGIFNTGTSTVTITNTLLSGSSSGATGGGGGIFNSSGTVSLTSSTLSNSVNAGPNGGGIRNAGQMTVTNSTISGNSSVGAGGGIYTTGASSKLTVINSTISGNTTANDGGGVFSTISAPTRILNSTVSGNSAARHGGGVHVFTGTTYITNTTITNNRSDSDNDAVGLGGGLYMDVTAPTVNLSNTIVADNYVGPGVVENDIHRAAGTLNAFNNLIGTGGSGGVVHGVNGNLVGIANPMIGALANNGGPTLTHNLLPGSPAIHAGDSTLAVNPDTFATFSTDQRGVGFPRFYGTHVDIGSIEANVPLTLIVDNVSDIDDGNYGIGNLALREAVKLANDNPGLDSIGIDVAIASPTFLLFGGALTLTDSVIINGTNLNGLGGNSTMNANNLSLAVSVATGVTATISNFTIRNGRASLGGGINNAGNLTLSNVSVTLNTATLNGGGIYNTGTITLNTGSSVSTGNSGTTGAGVYNLGTFIMNGGTIQNNVVAALGIGGGMYNVGGLVDLTNVTVTGNSSTDGAGIYNLGGGSVTLTGSTVSNNSATRFGGGIVNTGTSTLTITNSLITGNSSGASGAGGGIYSLSGTVTISGSTISNNRTLGSDGGGIRNAGTLVMTNSTVSGNIAQANGGGIYTVTNAGNSRIVNSTISGNTTVVGDGGGILNTSSATTRLINSTVSGNGAADAGGGIYGFSGTIIITNTTITNNRADADNTAAGIGGGIRMEGSGPTVTMNNTIVADNFVGTGVVEDDIQRIAGTLTGSNNLIGTGGSGGLTHGVSGNQVGIADPMLGALANNGGPTMTHRLKVGSLAVDTGNNALAVDHLAAPLATDQRGNLRINNTTVDIGAVENTINLTGALTTNEGSTYSLTIGPVVDNAVDITDYRIDWGDGNIQTLTAAALTLAGNVVTHVYIDDDPTLTASDPYVISLDVRTAATSPSFVDSGFKNITVNNVNPVATLSGATPNGLVGTPVNMTGSFTDVGINDTIDNWNFTVTKNGGLVTSQSTASSSFTFTPLAKGHYVVSLVATDDDTGMSASVSSTIHVSGAEILTDPTDVTKTALFVYGTAGNDTINLTKLGVSLVRVQLNGVIIGTFAPTGRVIVQGGTGNDTITDSTVVQNTIMFGGEGNDTLTANGARDVLVGGNGNDVLTGGNGDDVLIGGDGADNMNGGADEDLLIGGSTIYDTATLANMDDLKDILDVWSATGAVGVAPLLLGNVTDDAFADSMTGGAAIDAFYADSVLDITDAILGETVVAI